MVTIGMNYFVIPGKEKVFEDACANVIETMGGIDGHEESSLYRQVGEGEPVYLISSRWAEEQAFMDFIAFVAFIFVAIVMLRGCCGFNFDDGY